MRNRCGGRGRRKGERAREDDDRDENGPPEAPQGADGADPAENHGGPNQGTRY